MAQCRKCGCALMTGTGFEPSCMDERFIPYDMLRCWPCPSCGCRRKHGLEGGEIVIDRSRYARKGSNSFLKAADLDGASTKVVIAGFREAELPSGLTAILDIVEFKGKTSFPLNMTNLDALIDRLGKDEKKWNGKKLKLVKVRVRNPSTGKMVDSLSVS